MWSDHLGSSRQNTSVVREVSTTLVFGDTLLHAFCQNTWRLSGYHASAIIQGPGTVFVFGAHTAPAFSQSNWGLPVQSTGSAMGRDSIIPLIGATCVSVFLRAGCTMEGVSIISMPGDTTVSTNI